MTAMKITLTDNQLSEILLQIPDEIFDTAVKQDSHERFIIHLAFEAYLRQLREGHLKGSPTSRTAAFEVVKLYHKLFGEQAIQFTPARLFLDNPHEWKRDATSPE